MENRDIVLFFLIICNIIFDVTFINYMLYLRKKNSDLESFLDDIYGELAKIRKK